MKLHLPKLLLTSVLATMVPAPIWAENLLETNEHWTMGSGRNSYPTYNAESQSITTAGGWGQSFATYGRDVLLEVGSDNVMQFTIALTSAGSDSVTGLALVGSTQALVVGSPEYNNGAKIGYALTENVGADVFCCGTGDWDNGVTSAQINPDNFVHFSTEGGADMTYTENAAYTISGTITRTAEGYTLDMSCGETQVVSNLNLGANMDVNRIVLFSDGAALTLSQIEISGFSEYSRKSITWNGTATNNTWDTQSTNTIWKTTGEQPSATAFHMTDEVTFGEIVNDISGTVNVTHDIAATSITINDNYTFNVAENATLRGNIELDSSKTLTKTGAGTLTTESALNGNLNMAGGTLNSGAISGDVKVTGGTLNLKGAEAITGSKLDIAGGTVFIDCNSGGSNLSAINKNTAVSIGAGGKLHLKGHDSLGWGDGWGKTFASILLKGEDADNKAELVLEDSSTTWSGKNSIGYELNMQGYSAVTGINGNNIVKGGSVTASGVGNSITFDFLQVSQVWNVTVNQDGQLAIHATATGTAADKKATIVKKGAGELTLTGSYNSAVDVQSGTLNINGQNVINSSLNITNAIVNATLDAGNNDKSVFASTVEQVNVGAGAQLNLAGRDMLGWYTGSGAKKFVLDGTGENAKAVLSFDSDHSTTLATVIEMKGHSTITGDNVNIYNNASLTVTDTGNTISVSELQVRNGGDDNTWAVSIAKDSELSITSKLAVGEDGSTSITKTGEGTLVLKSAESDWNNTLNIQAGTLEMYENASLRLATVVMSADSKLQAGTGTIKNLIMNSGSMLEANTAITLNGELSLGAGIELSGDLLESILDLSGSRTVNLFVGVESLVLDGTTYDSNTSLELGAVQLNTYFNNSTTVIGSDVYLAYDAVANTIYVGHTIPEPTTATLSLLALAGLCARRRRK